MSKFEKYLTEKKHLGIFILRLFVGLRLIYGVVDNIYSWEHMTEFSNFLGSHHFPFPQVNAVLSVYAQFICGLCILLGYKTRLASFLMVINFLIAILFVHMAIGDSIEGMTPAFAMLFGCLTLLFTGAEKLSLDTYRKVAK